MTGGQRVSHHVDYAVRLPNHTSCVCATPGTLRAKPQNIILNDQYCPRRNQSYDGVMVKRSLVHRAAELIKISPEPYILTNDLRQSLLPVPVKPSN